MGKKNNAARAGSRVVAGSMALLVASGALALVSPAVAQADSRPLVPSAATPVTAAADALPTVQINGVAWAQAVVGNTVYVGGAFTTARPAGAAAGTRETKRNNLLAYDIRTGELITTFAPDLNGQVLAVAASPDGRRIYVGGDFTTADGQTRKRVAAYDTATGALVANWKPAMQSQVRAIAATNDTVYLGGSITAVGGVSRSRLAAVRAADGSLLPWAPVPGVGSTAGNSNGAKGTSDQVMTMVLTNGGTQVVVGGRFDTLNGVKATGVGALDAVTGATRPYAVNQKLTNQGVNSAVYSLTTDGTNVYGTAYDYYGPGNLEGSFVVKADTGAIVEVNDCRGDTYSAYPADGVLYVASHTHDCGNIGGYPEQPTRVHKFGTAYTTTPTRTVGSSTITNSNFRGSPAGSLLNWFPTMTPGTVTGQGQAGWSVTGNGQYVVYGGEFPRVNGTGQQGLVRFAVPSLAPDKVGPAASDALTPVVVPATAGSAKLTWTATTDQDNENLTYRVLRDGDTAAPVHTTVQASTWWKTPAMTFTDTGLSGGTHRYRVTATDPFGNTVSSAETTVEVAAAPVAGSQSYASAVLADGATTQWRLGDRSGATTADSRGGTALTVGSGVGRGVAGALAGDTDTAASFNGSATATLATPATAPAPNVFTEEAWFQTSSTTGGRIMGFANAKSGSSSAYDRQVYLDANGRINFGATYFLFFKRTVTSTASYNDGRWHHVAASMGPNGMALYVDGKLAGSRTDTTSGLSFKAYFRVGSDKALAGASTFNGRIDEVALYPTVLSAEQVASHHGLGVNGRPANVVPTARFGAVPNDLAVAFDAASSVDPDGTLASYAWDFGDGTKATGTTAAHTYGAAGTYQVALAVTDDKGATATTTVPVTVIANRAPVAVFTPSVSDRTIAVDGSGSGDPDGRVAGLTWDFGDGSTATGATATHTYAADGTYRVTLTVADDDGTTTSTGQDLAVSAPVVLATDTFNRTVPAGLGTADTGGAWTMSNGTTRQSVAPGAATLRLDAPGNLTGSFLGDVSASSADVRTAISLSAAPTGSGTSVYVTGRRVTTNQEYRARVRFLADGSVGVTMSRLAGSTAETFIGAEVIVPGLTYTPGTALRVRLQVSGIGTTQLAATVWRTDATEPATPTVTRTDTTASLQAPGGLAVSAYLFGSATAPVVVRVADFSATEVR
jgi:PKD repeat protein